VRDQAVGGGERVLAQLAEGVGAGQLAARIVEVEAAHALRGIIQRLAQACEIGEAARQRVRGRRGAGRRPAAFARLPSLHLLKHFSLSSSLALRDGTRFAAPRGARGAFLFRLDYGTIMARET
jgi:hypothetical protein